MSTQKSGASGSQGSVVAPLYQRLPHGPHRLNPQEVTLNQRTRMHGAMIEAVAANGYERTSVKQVVGLAGVSRRSFYEQFANKQDCFLATFDLIAGRGATRVGAAYRAAEGDTEERLRAAFCELSEAVRTNWNSATLVIVEAPKVGTPGLLRLRRATATFEQMLSGCFEQAPDASALPGPVIRGIAGGLHAAMWMCLREGSAGEFPGLAEEMLRWTLLFQTPAAAPLAERLAERARIALANGRKPSANGNGNGYSANGADPANGDERKRLLDQALRLALVVDYGELSAPQIADAAHVPIDGFFELFEGKQDCFLAALDMLGEKLVALTDDPDLRSSDWPRAVRRVIGELRSLSGRKSDLRANDRQRLLCRWTRGDRAQSATRLHDRHAAHQGRARASSQQAGAGGRRGSARPYRPLPGGQRADPAIAGALGLPLLHRADAVHRRGRGG